jgi:hypothetical protein
MAPPTFRALIARRNSQSKLRPDESLSGKELPGTFCATHSQAEFLEKGT